MTLPREHPAYGHNDRVTSTNAPPARWQWPLAIVLIALAAVPVVLRYLGEVIDGRPGGQALDATDAEAHADAGGLAAEEGAAQPVAPSEPVAQRHGP